MEEEARTKGILGVDKGTRWSDARGINGRGWKNRKYGGGKREKKKEREGEKSNLESRKCYPPSLCLMCITEQNSVDVREIGTGAELWHSTGDNTRSRIALVAGEIDASSRGARNGVYVATL